jgi:hypothetical protein
MSAVRSSGRLSAAGFDRNACWDRPRAVNALGSYGGKDMVTALRRVAETDPSPEVEGSSIKRRPPKRLPRFRNEPLGKVNLKFTSGAKPQGAGGGQFLDTSGHCRPGHAPDTLTLLFRKSSDNSLES